MRLEEAVPPGLRLTLAGLAEAVRPLGVTDVESVMVPVNPLKLLSVIDDVPEEPAGMVRLDGLDEMVKSPTPTVTVAV